MAKSTWERVGKRMWRRDLGPFQLVVGPFPAARGPKLGKWMWAVHAVDRKTYDVAVVASGSAVPSDVEAKICATINARHVANRVLMNLGPRRRARR